MTSDSELLQRFAASRSEEAFSGLVNRYLNLVYSSALRQVNGDVHLARDISQSVFIDLARKAASLRNRGDLAGWLYVSTRYAAAKAVRSAERRQHYEQEAQAMATLVLNPTEEANWTRLAPFIDEAMHELRDSDREAILLRYFQNQEHAEVGRKLGVSENTARMRVERALEKLRVILGRRGVTASTGSLALIISSQAVSAAPAGLGTIVVAGTLSAVTAGSSLGSLITFMSATKIQTLVAVVIVVGGVTALLFQQASVSSLRQENDVLRRELGELKAQHTAALSRISPSHRLGSLRLPAPRLLETSNPEPVSETPSIYEKINGEARKLRVEQVIPYLEKHGRSASTLLAAYRTTGDAQFLDEAMKSFPNDPQVAFEAVFRKGAAEQDKSKWIENFKKSDPQNSLPNYLSALDHMKSGRMEDAIKELMAASGKTTYSDYTNYRLQEDQDVWISAGHSVAEAKTFSATQLVLPQLHHVKELGNKLGELAASYAQGGDHTSAQSALQMAAQLGQRYQTSPGETEISWLVGVAVERAALSKMNPNLEYGNGQTVQQRLDELTRERNAVRELNARLEPILPKLTDQDWISYQDRWRVFGEKAAIQWVLNKYAHN